MSSNHFKPYKILSVEDLTKVSNDSKLRFGDRLKKDIARFFNPRYAILVDDKKDFVLHGQERNQLWLGETYNDRPQFELAHLEKPEDIKYSAPNKKEWQRDLDKLLPVLDILTKAIRKTRSTNVDFVENVDQINYLPRTCKSLF